MERFLGMDTPLMKALSMLADLVILNLLWLVCCFPIVTIGASTTAMYSVSLKLAAGHDGYVWKRFFKAFKQNLKQSTIIHMAVLVLVGIIAVDYYMIAGGAQTLPYMQVVLGASLFLIAIFLSWVYPVLARFDNTLKNTCKNALAMAVVHLPFTILVCILNLIPIVILFVYTDLFIKWMILWILAGGSGIAYINSFSFNHCFKRYIPEEVLEAEKEMIGEI